MSRRAKNTTNNTRGTTTRPPVKVSSETPEPGLIAAMPASVRQAISVARQYESDYPGRSAVVTRGEKVLHRTANSRKASHNTVNPANPGEEGRP